MHPDELFMSRALELAERGAGSVSPNPMVGCVIVQNGEIIGEGWHKKYGEPHAEINALNSISDESLIPGSTIYVSLEPCSHYGKTPPCSERLIKERVGKVIIGCHDPNPLVNGSGTKILTEAGIPIEVSSLEKQAIEKNKRFFTNQIKKRPYIILKWAQTSDHFVARKDYSSKWISNAESRQLVHQWRSEEDAILIGRNTVEKDNPNLTVRDWHGRNPVRIIIHDSGKLDPNWNIFDQSVKTFCFSSGSHKTISVVDLIILPKENFLKSMLAQLMEREIGSLLVEGGSSTLKHFIDQNLWDEARIFTSTDFFIEGIAAPILWGEEFSKTQIGDNQLEIIRNPTSAGIS